MMDFLFPDFSRDAGHYQLAQAFWLRNWEELIRELGQAHLWKAPHYTTTFVDGIPCQDGNPIFSAVDPTRRLGVRIIQFEPTSEEGELVSWVDTFAKGEPEEIKELVISCSLTHETIARARDLIREFIAEGRFAADPDSAPDPSEVSSLAPADRLV
jgi:hypothetical protein